MPRPSIYGVNSKDSGVYMIKNLISGKIYIGSTKRLVERLSHHRQELCQNKHHSIHLQNAWNKDGENKFIFGVIEVIDELTKLTDIEQYYIDKYNASNDNYGYNICPLARSNLGTKHQKGIEDKKKRMLGEGNNFYNKNHSINSRYFIGLNNCCRKLENNQINIIKTMWLSGNYSQTKIAKIFNVSQPQVSKIINNKARKLNNYVPTP